MPDAKPMSPERLLEIECLLRLPARVASDGLRQGVSELLAEVRRLQSEAASVAAIRDRAFEESQPPASGPLPEFVHWIYDNLVLARENETRLEARIAVLETGSREASERMEALALDTTSLRALADTATLSDIAPASAPTTPPPR